MVQYGRKCLLCKNTPKREPGCRLFKFPARGSPMWHQWLEACGLREADIDVRSREPPRLCQRHFQKKDFLTRQLTGMAVPSVFPVTVYTEIIDSDAGRVSDGSERGQNETPLSEQVIEEVYQTTEGQSPIEYDEIITIETVGTGESERASQDDDLGDPEEVSSIGAQRETCTIEEHQSLKEDLQNERNKVGFLSRKLEEKERIIREQFDLLKQLGVHVVTISESSQQ